MPKIIFTSRYIKGGSHAGGLVKYMATRDGVELPKFINGTRPATQNQKKLIDEVVRAVPEVNELFEYEDYMSVPTVENASAFISTAFEHNPALWNSVRNYVEYIARRPGAQKSAASGHGLWNGNGKPLVLSQVVSEVSNHKGNIWTHVVSLRREDAERMGYNNAEAWHALVQEQLPSIATAMKIPMSDLRWYVAYHDKDSNPHIHMIVYSGDPTRGYLTEPSIEKMRSGFARDIYKEEFMHIYERKDLVRSQLNEFATERLGALARQCQLVISNDELVIVEALVGLGKELQSTKGKKQYGYLKPALKQRVDEIVKLLVSDPRIDEMYRHWCELTADVKRIYTSNTDAPPPLEHEKTFKTIKNMVIRQAISAAEVAQSLGVSEVIAPFGAAEPEPSSDNPPEEEWIGDGNHVPYTENTPPGAAPPLSSQEQAVESSRNISLDLSHHAGSLLRSLARLIQSDYEQQRQQYEHAVDRKLMAKIRRKQQELGQKFE